ncbi:hypothetical protein [Bacillus sp. ISL-46]|uniref:hypothetical protein n=1 Tax=Bacillus sp. ISL-46 TaxID=2819129 RepID=UPI0035AE82F3
MKAEVTVSLTILYGNKSYELWGQFNTENEVTDTEKEIWGIVRKIGSGAKSLTQLLVISKSWTYRYYYSKKGRDQYGKAKFI